ncbi:efflux RND transporter permease subunit [Aerosakkonema funiforme]|uniref:efflux RND transporter permease subunit n=1 Tax=Aerosakkonema funiforme TaxID=1246630 RepID=UPI0035B9FA07
MLNSIVKWSIAQRWLVVIASILITLWGFRVLTQMPLDVFPSFAPPQVEIQTEAPGLAPEEVESLVTRPIESAINGTPGVETVRSSSAVGISVVRVIFGWDTEIYRARQLVTERLQQAQNQLPQGVETPQISTVNSPLGAIIKYAFTTDTTPLMEVRRIVDWQVKNRLLAVPGVTQIVIFGGDERQYQVLVDPAKLKEFNVSLKEVTEAVEKANVNAPGGFLVTPDQELLIRGVGRIESIDQLKQSAITARNGTPVLLNQVADVQIGAALKRGDASLNGKKAIIVVVNKQPAADTPTVTRAVEAAMEEINQVLEQQQVFDLVVWLPESARHNLDIIRNLLVDTPNNQKIPLAQVAKVDYGMGPNTINRENVSRLIIVSANVNGRDLGSVITDIRNQVKQQVQLPSGYYIQYGGQFQAQEKATQTLLIAGLLAFVAITVLIYFAVKTIPATMMIMINLPLALVGGVMSVALGGGVISVASMVGFITLFGVATRNGLLLVDNYNNKLADGMPLNSVIVEGSMERLIAILMTALSSALGMVPLVIGSGAGKEILQPLAVVVLGGLFTSTALTLLVLPALYSQFGRFLIDNKSTPLIKDGKAIGAVFEQ